LESQNRYEKIARKIFEQFSSRNQGAAKITRAEFHLAAIEAGIPLPTGRPTSIVYELVRQLVLKEGTKKMKTGGSSQGFTVGPFQPLGGGAKHTYSLWVISEEENKARGTEEQGGDTLIE
jgi:hypothetical protein